MAESNISLTYTDFLREVSFYLGWGRDTTTLSANQTARADFIVQSAYRQFLFPPTHRWTFLSPLVTFATVSGTPDYDAPDDFGGIIGVVTVQSSGNNYVPLETRSEAQIRALRSATATQGRPRFIAVRAKAPTGTTGQRFEFLIWPKPDAAYTLQYRKAVLTGKLTTTLLYPLGGAQFGETILKLCLGEAELRENDTKGPLWEEGQRMLEAAIRLDALAFAPDSLGYDGEGGDMGVRHIRAQYSTYNGTLYD